MPSPSVNDVNALHWSNAPSEIVSQSTFIVVNVSFMLAFIIAFVVTPYTIKLAKKVGAIDLPKDERRINVKPMPRIGGLAVIAGFVVSIVY